MAPPVTLKHIAEEVNKTAVTVSKALRNHPDISKKTREEILRVAERMGYTPNLIARKLSSKSTRSIGLIVPHIAHPFFAQSIEAIYDEAHRREYDIILMLTGEDDGLEAQHIQSLLSMQVDGFLISVSETTKDISIFQNILNRGKRLVFFDRVMEGLDCSRVVCDNYQGTCDLVTFAIKNGYQEIGYIAGYSNNYIGRERRHGFEAAMTNAGLKIHPEWIIEGGFSQKDGYQGFMKLKGNGPLPKLIATVSYNVAMGVMKAIEEAGLTIPNDIDLIAFGDSEFNHFLNPALTVSRLQSREMGRRALDMLIRAIDLDDSESTEIVVPTELIIHDTGLNKKIERR
ncbi:LacI family DNA-binding transcriptional regulator [candidate division KSB1 bacterium]|nr:LacI family DNA-binding transcriptional regulator [candidate division KSB1 bacterium]